MLFPQELYLSTQGENLRNIDFFTIKDLAVPSAPKSLEGGRTEYVTGKVESVDGQGVVVVDVVGAGVDSCIGFFPQKKSCLPEGQFLVSEDPPNSSCILTKLQHMFHRLPNIKREACTVGGVAHIRTLSGHWEATGIYQL